MNTLAFFNRARRPLSVKTFDALAADDMLELADALNAGLRGFYFYAPDHHKRKEVSQFLPTARTVEIYVTNGSKTVNSGLHTEEGLAILTEEEQALTLEDVIVVAGEHIGATIRIEGDPNWNRVVGVNLLRDAFQGETGTRTATIYADAITLEQASIEALATDPQLETGEVLVHDDLIRQWGTDYGRYHSGNHKNGLPSSYGYRAKLDRKIGRPRRYWIGYVGDRVRGAVEPQGLILLDPIPDAPYNVIFEAYYRPLRFGMADFQSPVELPVADDLVEEIVLPLAWEYLVDSPLWRDDANVGRYFDRANRARSMATALHPAVGVPNNQMGTPRGY